MRTCSEKVVINNFLSTVESMEPVCQKEEKRGLFGQVNFALNHFVSERQTTKCKINQILVNSSDAITGHKLQGFTNDQLIVYS